MQTRQFVNQQNATKKTEVDPPSPKQKAEQSFSRDNRPAPALDPDLIHARSVDLAWNEVGIYPLLTVLLGVVGIYFAVWLANGGAQELAFWFTWR